MKTLINFLIKGIRGVKRRITKYIVTNQLSKTGDNFICDYGVTIYGGENITIGDNVVLNKDVLLQSCEGAKIVIGDNVTISYGVKIITGNLSEQSLDINEERLHNSSSIVVDNNVWIGANAILLPGVKIHCNTIVGAGSVVNKTLKKKNSLYAGIPSKFIKEL